MGIGLLKRSENRLNNTCGADNLEILIERQELPAAIHFSRYAYPGDFSQDESVIVSLCSERSPDRVPEYLRL